MQQQQQSQSPGGSIKATAGFLAWAAETVSLPLELLLHDRVGLRFVRVRGGLAALLIVAFSMLFTGQNLLPLFALLFLFLGRCAIHAAIWLHRTRTRAPLPPETTYFPGYPLLWRLLSRRSQAAVRWFEVAAVAIAGVLTSMISPPLGAYLVVAAVGLSFTLYLRYMAVMNRIWDMHDATVTQRMVADEFRELSGS